MAGLHFDITGDNSNFLRKLEESRNGIRATSKQIEESGLSIEQMFSRMAKGAAALGLGFSATQLVNDIVRVRGEFQQLEIAFETMLKSKDKASALMGKLTETAAKTPFDLQSVAQGAKQLLAYGTASEEVNDTLIRLGNIASGLSIPLGDLVYLYGTTQTQGRLFTQDVRQFMGRGIPLVKELAKEMGKTEQQINEMVTAGKIGFPQVEKVIRNMTDSNGQFYNLMEKQSASLTGQISNLGDAWDGMLNKIGTQTQGIASAGISAATSLIENYEEVGVVLASLVLSYGTYKAAIIVVNTLEKANIMIMRQAIIEKKLAAAANITLSNSMAIAAARGKMFALVQRNIVSSLKGIGKTLVNPYVLLGAAVGAATYGLYKFYTRETEVEQMQRQYNETKEAAIKREDEHRAKIDELINSIENETTAEINRVGAMETLKTLYPGIIEKYIDEEGHLRNLIALKKELAEFDATKKVEQNKTELQSYDERIKNQEEYIDRMRTNDQSAFDDEVAKLNELKRQREVARANVTADYISQSIKTANSMSDEEIANTINAYQKTLSENKNGEWFDSGKEFKVEDINRYVSALKNLQTTRANSVHDKEYWENQKKEAETALFALSDVEAAGKKGLELKSKIAGYDKKINSFSTNTSKQESAASKEAEKLRKEQEKSAEELLSLRRQNQQDEINLMKEGSDKKLKQIELDYQKELDAIKKQEKEWSKENDGKLTQEQSVEISTRYTNAESKKEKSIVDNAKERLIADQQALNEYLTKYGTFQQQKLAIAQEYAEKIRKAQEESGINSTEVKLLQREQHEKTSAINVASIKAKMDWVAIFGEFGGMFSDMIKPALEDAKKYIKTDEFKNSDQSNQKALIDAISQMEKSLGGSGGLNFKKLGQDIQIYQNSLRDLNTSKEEEKIAINKLKKAQEDYEKAIKGGTEQEKQTAKDALDSAQTNADTASINVKTQTDIANQNQQGLSDTAIRMKATMNNVTEGLSKLASGGLKNAYTGIIQATNGIKDAIGKTSESLKEVPIIGWILSIIDVLKDGLSNLVGGLLDAIFNAVSGIISDVLSGDLFVTIGKSIASGVGNILNSITFGGFNSWFNIGGNAKETAEKIDSLTASNSALKTSIDQLTEKMNEANGTKSLDYYEEAAEAQKKTNENYRQILDAQMGYSSSHHSNSYYWNLDQNSLNQVNKLLNTSLGNSWADFSKLTADQMNEIRTNLPDVWSEMMNEGKYGDRFKDDWNNYADQAGKLEELTKSINENLTQISFDNLRDSFVDTLMDMDASAEDFADDFEEYMMKALLNFQVGNELDEKMKSWYDSWAETMRKQDGKLTEEQIEQYRKEWDTFVQEGIKKRDDIANMTGYTGDTSSSSREASKKGIATASQDSVDENNGRLTVIQGHTYALNESVKTIQSDTSKIAEKLSYLVNMDKNMADMIRSNGDIVSHLSDISNYTSNLVEMKQYMYAMKLGIERMNDKGLKLSR